MDLPGVSTDGAGREDHRLNLVKHPVEAGKIARRADDRGGSVDGQLIHSTRLVLLDRQARIRGYYGTSEDSPVAQLVRDVKRVLAEPS